MRDEVEDELWRKLQGTKRLLRELLAEHQRDQLVSAVKGLRCIVILPTSVGPLEMLAHDLRTMPWQLVVAVEVEPRFRLN